MIRFGLVLLALLGGCSTHAGRIAREPDAMCVNDCLGAGGTKEFCQSRCSD
jgi:hypothetical protein